MSRSTSSGVGIASCDCALATLVQNGEHVSQSIHTIATPTPRMLISSLVQYNAASRSLSSRVRLNWEFQPSTYFLPTTGTGSLRPAPDGTPFDTSGDGGIQ